MGNFLRAESFFILLVFLTYNTSMSFSMRSIGSRGGQSLKNLMLPDSSSSNKDGSHSIGRMTAHSFCNGQSKRDQDHISGEQRVKQMLLCGYDATSRPVHNDSTTTRVNVALSLFHILDTDEKHQTFSILISVRLKWIDEYLRWDPTEFGNTSTIHIKYSLIWTPDIVISNSADDSLRIRPETYTIVQSNGMVLWMYPAVVKVTCTLQVKHFPFDHQSCNLIFISWTYNGHQVDVYHNESLDSNKIYYKQENQEWSVGKITTNRTERIYACCEEPYPDVTITVHLDRHSLFYIFNLIFPCFLIYLTSFLAFFLPVESGEKVNLELTILLALIVFLLVIGETLPPTPDSIPLLGILFAITMIMVLVALVMGVTVTNIHFRKFSGNSLPRVLQCYVGWFHCQYHRHKRSHHASNAHPSVNDSSTYSPVNRCFNARFIHGVLSDEIRQPKRVFTEIAGRSPEPEHTELLQRGNGFLKNGTEARAATISSSTEQRIKRVAGQSSSGGVGRGDSHLSLFDDCDLSSEALGVNFGMAEFTPENLPTHSGRPAAGECRRPRHPRAAIRSAAHSPIIRGASSDRCKTVNTKIATANSGQKELKCICKDPESWVLIARATDRFFFWLFAIGSVFVIAAVASSVPKGPVHNKL